MKNIFWLQARHFRVYKSMNCDRNLAEEFLIPRFLQNMNLEKEIIRECNEREYRINSMGKLDLGIASCVRFVFKA